MAFTDQADDLSLLGGELVGRVDVAFTGGLATDGQFAGGALRRKPARPYR